MINVILFVQDIQCLVVRMNSLRSAGPVLAGYCVWKHCCRCMCVREEAYPGICRLILVIGVAHVEKHCCRECVGVIRSV